MSIDAITGSGSTASLIDAIRALRAGNVAATQAVSNRFDPRDDTQVEEQSSARQRQAAGAKTGSRQQRLDAEHEQAGDTTPRQSSAFLTQALAQEQDAAASESVSATVAGSAAYANGAYADAVDRASTLSGPSRKVEVEVLTPNPSASSGRGVDLTV